MKLQFSEKLSFKTRVLCVSLLIFFCVFVFGLFCARNKPLWKDEFYSLTTSILPLSYSQILSGNAIVEANNSPLYYLVQKFMVDLFSYDPQTLTLTAVKNIHSFDFISWRWRADSYGLGPDVYADAYSNMFLRLVPLTLMSMAPAVLFFYFSLRHSFPTNFLAVVFCCSSWMYWWYGLEMRPYIYIFTLTVIQLLLLMEIGVSRGLKFPVWIFLGSVHCLLALTYAASLIQVCVAGIYLFIFSRDLFSWKRIAGIIVFPLILVFFYYFKATQFSFNIPQVLMDCIYNSFSAEALGALVALLIYTIISWLLFKPVHENCKVSFRWIDKKDVPLVMGAVFVSGFLLFMYVLMLVVFIMKSKPIAPGVFYFAYRYLIALVPAGVLICVLAIEKFNHAFIPLWPRLILWAGVLSVIVCRVIYTFNKVHLWVGF